MNYRHMNYRENKSIRELLAKLFTVEENAVSKANEASNASPMESATGNTTAIEWFAENPQCSNPKAWLSGNAAVIEKKRIA